MRSTARPPPSQPFTSRSHKRDSSAYIPPTHPPHFFTISSPIRSLAPRFGPTLASPTLSCLPCAPLVASVSPRPVFAHRPCQHDLSPSLACPGKGANVLCLQLFAMLSASYCLCGEWRRGAKDAGLVGGLSGRSKRARTGRSATGTAAPRARCHHQVFHAVRRPQEWSGKFFWWVYQHGDRISTRGGGSRRAQARRVAPGQTKRVRGEKGTRTQQRYTNK